MKKTKKIMLSGGGSGGSVSPLLAVCDLIKTQTDEGVYEFLWIGTSSGPEQAMVEREGIRFKAIRSGKLRRYWSIKNVFDVFNLKMGFFQSLKIIYQWKPSCLLTAGSFVSVPIAWAAWLLRVPVLVHQQDLRPGLANRLMAPFAKIVTVAFEKSLPEYGKKAVWIGNPARRYFTDPVPPLFLHMPRDHAPDKDLPLVAVIGGGQGAKAINELVPDVARKLSGQCRIFHVTGKNKGESVPKEGVHNYYTVDFLPSDQIAALLSLSRVVVSRAGMNFLTELSCLGKASVIIPMPGTHQEENARFFSDQEATVYLDQNIMDAENLSAQIKKMLEDKEYRSGFERRISRAMKMGAAENLLRVIKDIIC